MGRPISREGKGLSQEGEHLSRVGIGFSLLARETPPLGRGPYLFAVAAPPLGRCSPTRDRGARPDFFLVDAIDQALLPHHLGAALQALAETLGHPDGGEVLRVDEADDAVSVQGGEGIGLL
jgi:hypothetical protein